MNSYKFKCGHTVESEELISNAEDILCEKCEKKLQKLREQHTDCNVTEVSYYDFKTKYSTCDAEPGSYNAETKTINVFIPHDFFKKPEKVPKLTGLFDGNRIFICDKNGNPVRKAVDQDKKLIAQIIIKPTVKKIRGNAFAYCDSLTKITIPEHIESIGDYAFCFCGKLKSIIIPNKIKTLNEYTFASCWKLNSVTLSYNLCEILPYAFGSCCSLKEIRIPASVSKIHEYAFSGCNKLEKVIIENNNTEIDDTAFEACSFFQQGRV